MKFESRTLDLTTGGTHEFDAVSTDLQVVASIKAAGGKTTGGRRPSGKMRSAEAELYYLTLISARKRLLVLTSTEFYEIMSARLSGRLAPGIELALIPLSKEIEARVEAIRSTASGEVSPWEKQRASPHLKTSRIAGLIPKVMVYLASIARHGDLVTYGDVAAAVGSHPRVMPKVLSTIRTMCIDEGWPPITAIVVLKASGRPGVSFLDPWLPKGAPEEARESRWRAMLPEVYGYDWGPVVRRWSQPLPPSTSTQ